MANLFCDHGTYTYALTPTWRVPQDGDGSGTAIATASAFTTIDFTSATAVAGNTFYVMGALLTCVASGAGNNQFNAGSGATLVDNLVAAINRTTNTSLTTAQAAGWNTPKVQDAVFARRTGNNLEIMTRAGSAVYNGLVSCVWSGITGLTAGPTWSGGSGGCWGWYINACNVGVMWPSNIAVAAYGVYAPLAGVITDNDTCFLRATNIFLEFGTITSANHTLPIKGNVCVDNADRFWAGTTGKTFTIGFPNTTNYGVTLNITTNSIRCVLSAIKRGGLIFAHISTYPYSSSTIVFWMSYGHKHIVFKNVLFNDSSNTGATYIAIEFVFSYTTTTSGSFQFAGGCEYYCSRPVVNIALNRTAGNVLVRHAVLIDDMDFTFPAASGIQPGLFFTGDYGVFRASNVRMTSPASFSLAKKNPNITINYGATSQVENARGFDMSVGNNMGFVSMFGAGSAGIDRAFAIQSNVGDDSAFRMETNTHAIDWLPGNQFPFVDAYTPNGTGWSHRWTWTADTSAWQSGALVPVTRYNKRAPTTGGNAARTVRVELLVPSALAGAIDTSLVSLKVAYQSPTGMATVSSNTLAGSGDTPVVLPASATVWNKGAFTTYVPVYLTITTPLAVVAGSEMSIEIVSSGACPGGASSIFISPNPSVT